MSGPTLYAQYRKIFQEIWRERLAREAELDFRLEQRLQKAKAFKEEMMSKLANLDKLAEDLVDSVVRNNIEGENKDSAARRKILRNEIYYYSKDFVGHIEITDIPQIKNIIEEADDAKDTAISYAGKYLFEEVFGLFVMGVGIVLCLLFEAVIQILDSLGVDVGIGVMAIFLAAWLIIAFVLTRKIVEKRTTDIKKVSMIVAKISALAEQGPNLVEKHYEQMVSDAQRKYHEDMEQILRDFRDQVQQLSPALKDLTQTIPPSLISWQDMAWRAWRPGGQEALQRLPISIGTFRIIESISAPALLPLPNSHSLLIKAGGAARDQAIPAIQALLLRLLATIPPGKTRFTFIDPVGLGQNVAPFMRLADYDEQLVTYRAWSEPAHIEQRLAELTEHMENVIQKYLRNEYATIEEYNQQAGEIAEPYRFLVIFDFPTNFSEDAARRLLSIAQNGPRCGVYAIILADPSKEMPHGFNLADLERACTVISWNGEHFIWEDEDFRHCALELDTPPEPELFNRILDAVGEAAKEAGKVEVPFERIAPPPDRWWREDSREGIRVPLGPAGARRLQYLELGQGTAHHVLVAGRVGSGKSTLLHVLITNLALTYSPDEVELYLVDFKKGVEFKGYATYALPHARVVAIESEREFGLSVLQGLDAELKRRGDLFRAAGVDHIADYREKTGERMPRILLIVDEFQEFFTEDDAVAAQASQVLDRLVRQGRAFGVHVLLASQTLAGSYTLARSTIDQMAVRIALQCSEADSRLILADDNPAARLLSRPGEAIYNDANGLVEGNHPFQVAWLPDDERERYLQRIRAFAEEQGYRPPQPQIVFEGNAPALIEHNQRLNTLLSAPIWPEVGRRVFAWLGEPVAIKDPTAAHFRRQSASNLLIVGRDDESALGMVTAALLSLAAQYPIPDTRFYLLDFTPVDAPYADLLARLAALLPHRVKRGRRRQLPDLIAEVAAEVNRRLDQMDEDQVWKEPAVYLFIYGLQRARDLRQEEDFGFPFGVEEEEAPPNPAQQFATIVREGPEVGVHTIVWCDTYANLTRTLDRRSLREFEMRVAMQMSAEDSANLIDTPAASKLGLYRAYFYSEDESRLEKFRPYGLPSEAWLAWVGERFSVRTS